MAKRTGLGRGLDALLGPTHEVEAGLAENDTLQSLPVELLRRGRYQPRVDMRTESLEELADSIRVQGLVQPIIVRPLEPAHRGDDGSEYEIVAGERRWRAAQLAGLDEIPAIVREVSDRAAVAMALIENIQREDLNPLEEARALDRLIGEFDMTHSEAAGAVGRSRATVSNLLRLLELSEPVKAMVQARELEMGHARALLALRDPVRQGDAAKRVSRQGLSVRETERLVKRLVEGRAPTPAPAPQDPDVRRLESDLHDRLGARVSVQHGRSGAGKLVIRYNSLNELDGILEHIK